MPGSGGRGFVDFAPGMSSRFRHSGLCESLRAAVFTATALAYLRARRRCFLNRREYFALHGMNRKSFYWLALIQYSEERRVVKPCAHCIVSPGYTTMRSLRVYVDTSVFGGVFDVEYAKETKYFFKLVRENRFRLAVSDQVHIEIDPAPPPVKHFFEMELANIEYLTPSSNVKELADLYIARKVLTEKYRSDATHIAYAAIYKCDGIISWNFEHMVKLNKMVRYNMINAENGYSQLFMASPKEVKEHENT